MRWILFHREKADDAGTSCPTPSIVPWPPLIYCAAVPVAVALQWLIPLTGRLPGWAFAVGLFVMLAGIALDGSAMLSMIFYKTNILPHRPATKLIVTFPFSVSRNPIYLGNTLLLGGAAFVFNNLWLIPMTAIAIRAVTVLAVEREELHLAALFGLRWQKYAERVPRWLRLFS